MAQFMSIEEQMKNPVTWCLIAGDNHGRFEHLVEAVKLYKPEYMLSVGDLEPERPLSEELAPIEALGCRFLFAPGNHETDRPETWLNLETAKDRNMHGKVVQVGHLKCAFLGGVFREEVWYPPQEYRYDSELFASAKFDSYQDYVSHLGRKTSPQAWAEDPAVAGRLRKHHTTIFPSVYRSLLKERAHILVTHEAGIWAHTNGFQAIDELRRRMGAKLHFFGHHHCYRFRQNDRGECSFGVGLRGILAIDGSVIREGELDRQRPDPQFT
jgi:predicted phosphodiesterase